MDEHLIGDNQTVEPEKLDLRSHAIAEDKRQELLRLFPEIRTEGGKIDIERLKLVLGETVDVGKERYGMNWPGKADCFKTIQMPSLATLRPCPEESINFDPTENLIIEGDNLEVLKLLQKSYLGKVKMIYIDPPYNTGNDFIYPDNYSESLQTYLEYTGQVDAEGRKFGTNTDTDGRFHSKWLNMMYPRLYLARNLLKENGLVFISIDDNEVDNLRKLCNEIFGEQNFIEGFIWKKSYGGGAKEQFAVRQHEFCLLYAKNVDTIEEFWLPPNPEAEKKYYGGKDEHFGNRGPFRIKPLEATKSMDTRDNLMFPILAPDGTEIFPKKQWWWSKDRVKKALAENGLIFGKTDRGWTVSYKQYLIGEDGKKRGAKPFSIIDDIYTQHGTADLRAVFNDEVVLQFPKPVRLIERFLNIAGDKGAIILDFFAGSGTTGQAVIELNKQDGGNRKFILVQLPEPTGRSDYPIITDITKERVRRVIQKLNDVDSQKTPQQSLAFTPTPALPLKRGGSEGSGSSNIKNMSDDEQNPLKMEESCSIVPSPSEGEGQDGGADVDKANNPDRGFKVFKLAESNFKPWEAERPNDAESLARQLDLHIDHIREGRTAEDLLYELLLKSGFPLTTPVELLAFPPHPNPLPPGERGQDEEARSLGERGKDGGALGPEGRESRTSAKSVYSVADGALFICLERELTLELIRAIAEQKPERVVLLDEGFAGNDQLKANAVQIFKTKGVTSFKTV